MGKQAVRFVAAVGTAVSLLQAPEAAANPVLYNGTGEVVKVYWRQVGCTGTAGGYSNVCGTDEVQPGGRTSTDRWPAVASLSCLSGVFAPGFGEAATYTIYDADVWVWQELGLVDVANEQPIVDFGATWAGTGSCVVREGAPPIAVDPQAEVVVGEGYWGTWRKYALCPRQTRARGYQVRIEQPTGDGDETALNSVRLLCGRDGAEAYGVQSASGYQGDWSAPVFCSGSGYITGAMLRIQPKQGSDRDDTAANDVKFVCGSEKLSTPVAGGAQGAWGSLVSCPAEKPYVCGLTTRLEAFSGKGVDDTVMNGLRLECCSAQMTPEPDGNSGPVP